jgi:hypothetical protein
MLNRAVGSPGWLPAHCPAWIRTRKAGSKDRCVAVTPRGTRMSRVLRRDREEPALEGEKVSPRGVPGQPPAAP